MIPPRPPARVLLSAANTHDSKLFEPLLARAPPLGRRAHRSHTAATLRPLLLLVSIIDLRRLTSATEEVSDQV